MHILKRSFRFAIRVFVNHEMGTFMQIYFKIHFICLREVNVENDP